MIPPFKCRPDELLVISDFDRTLTKATVNGKPAHSIKSILNSENLLGEQYSKEDTKLVNKYSPIEKDPNITRKKKLRHMWKWRDLSIKLLMKYGLSKEHMEQLSRTKNIQFRDNIQGFLRLLNDKNIPLVMISASGSGAVIPYFFVNNKLNFRNQFFVVNQFFWDKNGKLSGVRKPVIHPLNKNRIELEKFLPERILKRKFVLILGDMPDDVEIKNKFKGAKIFSVGFLNSEYGNLLTHKNYKNVYDFLIENDGPMDDVIKLIESIIS